MARRPTTNKRAPRRGSSKWWVQHYGKPCVNTDIVELEWYPGVVGKAHAGTELVWQALGAVMLAYGYEVPTSYTGDYACRMITNGKTWSGHAWPVAKDVNAKTNPYIDHRGSRPILWGVETDMPAAMIREIESITASGRQALAWGGRWKTVKDAMHFQLIVTLEEIAGGVESPRGFYTGEDYLAHLSEDAQKHFQKLFERLETLDPKTNEEWGKVLIEDFRDRKDAGQAGKHKHPVELSGETGENE